MSSKSAFTFLNLQSLDPQDVIPEELIETEMSADVLKHPCPTGFQNLKDDDVSKCVTQQNAICDRSSAVCRLKKEI